MTDIKVLHVQGIQELEHAARQLVDHLKHPVILFKGELGAGKTTLIKEILKLKNSEDSGSSPSYAIINQYSTPGGPVYHIDLYRMNTAEEVFQLGVEDFLYSGNLCLIEWPQIIEDYLDMPHHLIEVSIEENNDRKITLY